MTVTRPNRVLVVTAERADDLVVGLDGDAELAVTETPRGDELGSQLADTDCVVAVHGGGVDAVDVLQRVRAYDPALPVVVVAAETGVASEAVAAGVSEFVPAGSP